MVWYCCVVFENESRKKGPWHRVHQTLKKKIVNVQEIIRMGFDHLFL